MTTYHVPNEGAAVLSLLDRATTGHVRTVYLAGSVDGPFGIEPLVLVDCDDNNARAYLLDQLDFEPGAIVEIGDEGASAYPLADDDDTLVLHDVVPASEPETGTLSSEELMRRMQADFETQLIEIDRSLFNS